MHNPRPNFGGHLEKWRPFWISKFLKVQKLNSASQKTYNLTLRSLKSAMMIICGDKMHQLTRDDLDLDLDLSKRLQNLAKIIDHYS